MAIKRGRNARQSTGLSEFDYSFPGAYFITLVTSHRECLFGKIVDRQIEFYSCGEIAHAQWFKSVLIHKEIELHEDEFIVMPNHVHGIVWVTSHGPSHLVRATGRAPLRDHPINKSGSLPKSLGSFVAGYKSSVTKQINQLRKAPGQPVWMRNYHDRVIRNIRELRALKDYIHNNPLNWELDREYPKHNAFIHNT